MKLCLYSVVILILSATFSLGYRVYQQRILNGDRVPNPCCPGTIWERVGHAVNFPNLNAFGYSFRNHGRRFTYELCMEDSDGDGTSNGEELGMTPRGSYNLDWLCRIYEQYSNDPRLVPALQRYGLITNPRGHPGFCDATQRCNNQQNYLQCHTVQC